MGKKNGVMAQKFLVSLIIACILLALVGCKVWGMIFHKGDPDADASFSKLTVLLSDVSRQPSGAGDSMVVNIYRDGGIVAFNDDAFYMFRIKSNPKDDTRNFDFILRPMECPEGIPCVCKCPRIVYYDGDNNGAGEVKAQIGPEAFKRLEEQAGIFGVNTHSRYACLGTKNTQVKCEPAPALYAKTYKECNDVIQDNCVDWSTKGGFLVSLQFSNRVKSSGLAVENYKGLLGACLQLPCFSTIDKKVADFGIFFKKKMYACIANEDYCKEVPPLLKAIMDDVPEKKKWHMEVDKTGLDNYRESFRAIRFRLTNKDQNVDEYSYLVENPNEAPGPFREVFRDESGLHGDIPYAFDEFNSTPYSGLRVYLVELSADTEEPVWDTEKEVNSFSISFDKPEDTELTIKSGGFLGIHADSAWLVDIGNRLLDTPASPPYPLVVYYKRKT